VRSSSHALLDDAALDAARGLPRVPFPPDVRPRALRVRLPVVFELR
jgi:TonB family protein